MKKIIAKLLHSFDVYSLMLRHKTVYEKRNVINKEKVLKGHIRLRNFLLFSIGSCSVIVGMFIAIIYGVEIIKLAYPLLVLSAFWFFWLLKTSFSLTYDNSVLSINKLVFIIIGYILTTIVFGFIYDFMTLLEYFEFANPQVKGSLFTSMYYSVVTITTLGYGDIVPGTFYGQITVIVEVLLGLIYAILGVGTFFSSKTNDEQILKYMGELLSEQNRSV